MWEADVFCRKAGLGLNTYLGATTDIFEWVWKRKLVQHPCSPLTERCERILKGF
jgi:hypothetical protein